MKRVILFLSVSVVTFAFATTGIWTSKTGGDWSDTANWQDATLPDDGGHVRVGVSLNSGKSIWLDKNVNLTSWSNGVGSARIESHTINDTAERYAVMGPTNGQFTFTNQTLTVWGVPLNGACNVRVGYTGLLDFCAPQLFTGTLLQSWVGTRVAADYRYAAVTGDTQEDSSMIPNASLDIEQNSMFRVYGRKARSGYVLRCRVTPGSADLVVLPTNVVAQNVLSGAQRLSGNGIAEGAYVTRVPEGAVNQEQVVCLSEPCVGSAVTTQMVTFAAGNWVVRQKFPSVYALERNGIQPTIEILAQKTSLSSGTAIFEAEKLSGSGLLNLKQNNADGGEEGRFEFNDMFDFTGTFRPYGRALITFKYPKETNLQPLVGNPAAWFDASVTASLNLTEDGSVLSWQDVRGGDNACIARVWDNNNPPKYVAKDTNGKPAIDFGVIGSKRALVFDNEVTGIKAAFIVLEGSESGGTLLGAKSGCTISYPRGFDAAAAISIGNSNYRIKRHNALVAEGYGGHITINARNVQLSAAGVTPDWAVYALSIPSVTKNVSAFALDAVHDSSGTLYSGGQRLAEVLLYTNDLTEAECSKIERHLMRKWVKKLGVNGIAAVDTSKPAVFGVEGDSGIIEVQKMSGTAPFEIKAGTRFQVNNATAGISPILNESSTLVLNIGDFPTEPVASNCVLWLDASNPDGAVINDANEVEEAKNLSPNALTPSLWPGTVKPTLITDEKGRCVWEFGERDNGCCLRCFTNFMATTVFMMWQQHTVGCQPLGALKQDYQDADHPSTVSGAYRSNFPDENYGFGWDFWRNGLSGIITSKSSLAARSGDWYLDGTYIKDAWGVETATERFMLHEGVMVGWGGRVSAIGAYNFDNTEANYKYSGGFRLAEMIIYDRTLTEAERIRVETYLLNKWMPEKAKTTGYADHGAITLGTVQLLGNATIEAPSGTRLLIEKLTGTGTLKTSAGVVVVAKSVESGVTIEDATKGMQIESAAKSQIADGAILHVDSSDTSSITPLQTIYAKYWKDSVKGCNLRSAFGSDESWVPMISDAKAVGLPYQVINFDVRATWEIANNRYKPPRGFKWDTRFENIRTVFWMWRDHPTVGGGWLLGDGEGTETHPSDFARGNKGLSGSSSAYFDKTLASEAVLNGTLRCDGEVISTTSVPVQRWHVLSLRTTAACAADRVAADRVNLGMANENMSHWGGMQMGEMIIYDRALSDVEIHQTEDFLMSKWLGTHVAGYTEGETRGVVKAETILRNVEGSSDGYIYALSDEGTVTVDDAKMTIASDSPNFTGDLCIKGNSYVTLLGTNYLNAVIKLDAGSVLDLGGRTVTIKKVSGSGRVINGVVDGIYSLGGTTILMR